MTLTGGYGTVKPENALEVLLYAVDAGAVLLDTANVYPNGEELIASALARRPGHGVQVVTKVGLEGPPGVRRTCGRPECLRQACEASLRRLRTNAVDVLLLHRIDDAVPVEESIGALGELVTAGTIKEIGISTADIGLLRRACCEQPLSFVQTELSVLFPGTRHRLVSASSELGVTVMAHSPLSRGLLARSDLPVHFGRDDARNYIPYATDARHRQAASAFHAIAAQMGVMPVRLAIGWLLGLTPNMVPLPGARTPAQVRANFAGQAGPLTATEQHAVDEFISQHRLPISEVDGGDSGM